MLRLSRDQLDAFGVLWVGGLGYLFFAYPRVACRIFHREPTLKRLRLVRITGAVELTLVFTGALLTLIWGFFSN
jgi:hypothetical protein